MTAASQPSGASRSSASFCRPTWQQLQALAFLAAGAFAYNGARILNESPTRSTPVLDNFDASMPWLGLALLSLAVAAWLPARSTFRWRREAVAEFWRAHWLEIVVFAAIFAFGVFMRVYRFQTTLPPSEGLCCEESINGGAAYRALHGDRPLNFLITRWGSAFGFLAFGENTLGLRFFFVVMAILTLIAFYFLLRELVSVPVALFGMALYAAAWWPSLRARQASEGTVLAVLFALVLVRGIRARSPLLLLCAGALAGFLSYEYEPFKAVPIIAAVFLVGATGREVLLRAPFTPAAAWARARSLLDVAWRPVVIALMATGIVLVPMVIGTHRGYDLYLTSVHRNEAGRTGDRFADAWRTQLKWEAQIFLPIGPNEYPAAAPREIPGKDLLDPLTAWLSLAGLAAGVVLLLRGFRGLFVAWVSISFVAGAAILANFGPWKFLPLVPVFIALAAYFLNDVRSFAVRRFPLRGALVFSGLLVAGAAFAFWWNANMLFRDVAGSDVIAASYSGKQSMIYSVCHYLQGRSDDNYAVVYSGDDGLTNFAALRESYETSRDRYEAETRAWGDFIWSCHDLPGTAVPAAEELWPLRGLSRDQLTLVLADPVAKMDDLIAQLNRAYPNLGEPTKRVVGPAGGYEYAAYELPIHNLESWAGLWADYVAPEGGAAAVSRVDDVSQLSWDSAGLPLAAPFTVHWRGLIYRPAQENLSLHAVTDEPVQVRLDGQVVYDTRSGEEQDRAIDVLPGWHPVEITLDKQHEGGEFQLAWTSPAAPQERQDVARLDLFPLEQLSGWMQYRTLGLPGGQQEQTSQRFDFAPHELSARAVTLREQTPALEQFVTEERWRGVWHVADAGEYQLLSEFQSGTVTILVDGVQVAQLQAPLQGPGLLNARLPLQPGNHAIEVVQELDADVSRVGLRLSAFYAPAPGRQAAEIAMNVTPY